MAKLLKISTKVYLPGATAASWKLIASASYLIAGRIAGGAVEGALEQVPNEPDWWQWPTTARVWGGVLGDKAPPLVTVRVRPVAAGKSVLDTVYQGHPREMVAGGESWDLSAIGEGSGPVLVTEAERVAVGAATILANNAAGVATGAGARADAAAALTDASRNLMEQTAGIGRAMNEAALTGKAAGTYELIATAERVSWSGTAVTARSPMLATPSVIDRQRGVTAESQGVQPGQAAAALSAALAAGQTAMRASNQSTLHLGGYLHTLSTSLVLNDYQGHLRGQGGSDWVGSPVTPSGTVLSAPATVSSLVNLAGRDGGGYAAGSYSVEGITFRGTAAGDGTRTQSGLRSTQGNGPGRPLNVQHTTFRGLFAGLRSDVPAGQSTGVFCANLFGITARENDYGLYSTGTGAWGNLNIIGSVIEQNAKGGLRIEAAANGGLFGGNTIFGNLLEGQPDPIVLEGGLVANLLGPNYFEANSGKIRLAATNGASSQFVLPQYVHNCPEMYGELKTGYQYVWDRNISWRVAQSQVRVFEPDALGIAQTATPTSINLTLNPAILRHRLPPPLGYLLLDHATGTTIDTPFGPLKCAAIAANGFTGWLSPNLTTQAGEALVAVALARRSVPGTPVAMGAGWYDNTYNDLASSAETFPLSGSEWNVVFTVMTGAPVGTKTRFRWLSNAAALVGPTTFYRVALPLLTDTAASLAAASVPLFMGTPSAVVVPGATTTPPVQFAPGGRPSAYGRWSLAVAGRYARLPSGQRRVLVIAANGNTSGAFLILTGVSQTASELVRVSFWGRCPDGGNSVLTPNTINQTNAPLTGGAVRATVTGSEWVSYTMDLPVDAANSANAPATVVKLRILTTGSPVEISDVTAYSYDPAALVAPPPWIPLTHAVSIPATILAGQTSVVVPHGQPFAPGVVTADPGGAATVWVSAVDATNVTVTAAAAPGTDLPIVVQSIG